MKHWAITEISIGQRLSLELCLYYVVSVYTKYSDLRA
jgi:hypothetical protein